MADADQSHCNPKPTDTDIESQENSEDKNEEKSEEKKQSSLHHSLLGPSLQKAGQDSVDQSKVAEIIYQASIGSRFFKNEQRRDDQLTQKVEAILARKKHLESCNLSTEIRRADECIAQLEAERDLSQYIVHVDCDAFYASVEELDKPELKLVPMAVGKGVITTCNYKARQFGVRSGMAGHIAQKLCPQLICLPINFQKYHAKAQEIRQVIAKYDPNYESASCDEAYLNITNYCHTNSLTPSAAVSNLRSEIFSTTKITVSAGIGPNTRIAKIASNKNKPNGQFEIPNDREEVMNFMADLSVRKINGVGRVFERELDSVGIKTCKDIYPLRGMLTQLFGEKSTEFFLKCYLGIGRAHVQPAELYERKSVGTERTFPDLWGTQALRDKMKQTAADLEKDLADNNVALRTLTLKIKLHTYPVHSRQRALHRPIYTKEDIYHYALPLLSALEEEFKDQGGLKIRLMGLRGSQLVDRNKKAATFWENWAQSNSANKNTKRKYDDDGWEIWPDEEIYDDELHEQKMQTVGADTADDEGDAKDITREILSQGTPSDEGLHESSIENPKGKAAPLMEAGGQEPEKWECPICHKSLPAEDKIFNEHVDFCLSKDTIKEVVNEASTRTDVAVSKQPPAKRAKTEEKKRNRDGKGGHFPLFKQSNR